MEDISETEHLSWVIEGRAKTQRTTLRLYKLFIENEEGFNHLNVQAQDLVAISFSLWRAVFLADRTGQHAAKNNDAKLFLGRMLTDNAITFAQDRISREWSFNYYLDYALSKLQTLQKTWPSISERGLIPEWKTARNRWDHLQEAFDRGVGCLEISLRDKAKSKKT